MGIYQSFIIALEMLRLHKLRAFLTMLGVIIGVMSVTIIVMISNGFQYYMSSQFEKLGSNTIMIFFDPGRMQRESRGKIEGLRNEDVAYLLNRVSSLDIAAPLVQAPSQKLSYLDNTVTNARLYASDDKYLLLNKTEMASGRGISSSDVAARASVCMIGEELRDKLFPDKQAVGKFLALNGITVQVIGVIKREDFMGSTNARDLLMPISTFQDKWTGSKDLMMISARPKPGVSVDTAMDGIWEALMLKSGNKRLYRVDSSETMMKVIGGVFGAAGTILAAIAALSLLVGGIGIMNIMLVSVTERTKEIGLRKAVGARSKSVLLQFLVEAATLSLVGGLIGMGLAWMLGLGVTTATASMGWPSKEGLATPFPLTAGIMAAAFSAGIGMVFGFYPAVSAAKLDPIVALRRE